MSDFDYSASRMTHLTHRELLANRARARRAANRGRNTAQSSKLMEEIETELDRRRNLKANRLFNNLPRIQALED